MNEPSQFDFWYAINNTRVVVAPIQRLETFGATIIHYHLVSELMDSVNKIRVREGRIVAQRPQIITLSENMLEGFGAEAEKYLDWLRDNSQHFRMLQYGFIIRKEEINDEIITDTLEAVLDRVVAAVKQKGDPLTAVVAGVDSPWEVSILKMMFEVSNHSFQANVREMESHRMFAPNAGLRFEIETEFQLAGRQPARITELGNKLQKHGLFKEYEDRFFALIKAKPSRKK
jgi:hypothetical protein